MKKAEKKESNLEDDRRKSRRKFLTIASNYILNINSIKKELKNETSPHRKRYKGISQTYGNKGVWVVGGAAKQHYYKTNKL